jgi:hypothetical protein
MKLDIESKKQSVEKIKLENRKLALEIADQELELIIKTHKLVLSDIEREIFVSIVSPNIELVADRINIRTNDFSQDGTVQNLTDTLLGLLDRKNESE